jgi:hypothetical protein
MIVLCALMLLDCGQLIRAKTTAFGRATLTLSRSGVSSNF